MLAARLMTHIELHFGRRIPRATWSSATTVEELARVIPEQPDGQLGSPLVRMQAGTDLRKPFFFLHGQLYGWGLYCKVLAPLLGQEQPFYVLHPWPAGDDLPATVEMMAQRYLRVLRDARPHGPYLLGGYCHGGLIALEMAQQLRAQGEIVELLVLVETLARNYEFRVHRKLVSLAARLFKIGSIDELDYFLRLCRVSTDLRRLSSLQKAKFLLTSVLPRVAKWVNRRLWQRSKPNAAPQPRNVTASSDGWGLENVEAHYRRLVRGYVPRSYPGRLTIFRARDEKHPTADPAMGWRSLAQDVDPHLIPGDHHGCTQLAESLPILGEHLKSCLDACHTASHYPNKTQEEELLLG